MKKMRVLFSLVLSGILILTTCVNIVEAGSKADIRYGAQPLWIGDGGGRRDGRRTIVGQLLSTEGDRTDAWRRGCGSRASAPERDARTFAGRYSDDQAAA